MTEKKPVEIQSSIIRCKDSDGNFVPVFPVSTIEEVFYDIDNEITLADHLNKCPTTKTLVSTDELFTLTKDDVSELDVIRIDNRIFIVKDTNLLDRPEGYIKILSKYDMNVPNGLAVLDDNGKFPADKLTGNIPLENMPKDYSHDWSSITNKPTTLNGYGITDAVNNSEVVTTAEANKILKLDNSGKLPATILNGTIPIENLPHGSLERCIVVADDNARFKLTKNKVQTGDTVKVTATKTMYFIVDDNRLNEEAGYEEYTAGSATSVPWSGIQDKPTTLSGYGITDAVPELAFTFHTNDLSNPHGVKYYQIGAEPTITGAATTITKTNLTTSRALVSDSNGKVAVSSITSTELGYLDNVTSNIQTQLNSKQATITGAATTITGSNLTLNRALVSDASGKVVVSAVTSTELGYLSGATSNIQTQLNGKQATITGAATTIIGSNLTTNRALVSNASGKVVVSGVTSTELGYLSGVTSAIQTQLNGKASTTHTHNYAGSSSAGGAATSATKLATSRTLTTNLASNTAASFNGTANVSIGVTGTLPIENGGTGATNAAGILTNLGVTATAEELNYVDGVTSNIQNQLNGKQATITGAATTIVSSNLTTSRALVSDSSGKVAVSSITSTELSYLDNVTSNIQTQLNGKAQTTHTHNYAGSSSAGGAATSATKLATSRTLTTNLGSSTGASFNGTANASIGVTGTLPIENGGTGFNSLTNNDYSSNRIRGISLVSSLPNSIPNGCIVGVYI